MPSIKIRDGGGTRSRMASLPNTGTLTSPYRSISNEEIILASLCAVEASQSGNDVMINITESGIDLQVTINADTVSE